MNRKLASVILLVAVLGIVLVAAIPAAADEPVYVYPPGGGPFVASADDTILLDWWWWTTTKGLVNVYVKAIETTYTLRDANGQIVWSLTAEEAEAYWSEPFKLDWREWFDYPMPYMYASDGSVKNCV